MHPHMHAHERLQPAEHTPASALTQPLPLSLQEADLNGDGMVHFEVRLRMLASRPLVPILALPGDPAGKRAVKVK